MKKFATSSKSKKTNFVRIIGLTAFILTAAVFINALPNITAQANNNSSFFGLADLFGWNSAAPATLKSDDNRAPNVAGTCDIGNNVEVEATLGTNAGYSSLGLAFTAINAGTHSGTITIDVCGNTAESASGAVLNASGTGAAAYSSIIISPAGGTARTITGAAIAGSPLIDLNGADNVTINGLNTSGNSLTISNTTVSATSGTSTIRFIGDATNNTITNTGVLGSATMPVGTNGGNIFFGAVAATTGNDNNTISNCNIGPAGSNLPTKGFHMGGSSNTDPGTANSGIVIANNNIYDYFGAAVASAGVYITSGTVGTTISNNRFYQTATRTQTTASQHSAISISNTSGNAYQITGNTIGFANSSGTGTYNFVGISGSLFFPISLAVGTTTATSVQGNTIAGIAMSGAMAGTGSSAPFIGIAMPSTTAGLATIGNTAGNTIGSLSATGSITYTSTSTSASDVMGMFNFGSSSWTTSNNNIGGITISNSSTGAANFYGLRVNTSSSVTWTANNNTIGGTVANSINSTSTATGTIVNGMLDSTPALTATGNTIRNINAAGGTGTGSSASVVGIVVNASSANHTVSQNTIFNLSNSNATAATVVTGINYSSSTGTNLVARNLIYNLTTPSSSATATINGINITGGTATYRNNMIALGNGLTNGVIINGINETTAGTDNLYFNSIYIGGTGVTGTANTFAFQSSITTNTRNYIDNIFSNSRNNGAGTGKHYAIRVGGAAANPTGLTSNYNVFYTPGTGGVFGLFNSVDITSIGAWRTATGQDANSIYGDPQFLDPANATMPNLHINPAVSTPVEGTGLAIASVTDDFDGDIRANFTPTDIGADAGNFTSAGDISAPSISYTTLGNTASTAPRTLTVTVTDNVGATQVYIYYRVGTSGGYTAAVCPIATGTATNGTYTCTISATVVAGNTVQYFVAASDAANNVSTNPAGGTGTSASNITTPPTTPNSYVINGTISGNFTVGAGGTYTTLTAAVAALNNNEINGAVTLSLTDASYSTGETFPLTINANTGSSATNTVTIKPALGVTSTISGSSATCVINLNGADYVTIDGSNGGGTPAGTSRDLTIANTNTGTSSAVICLQTAASPGLGATNNVVKNANIAGNTPTTTLFGIFSGSSTISTTSTGTNNDNNTFQNNNISKAQFGIYSQGASAANKNTGNAITQNLMNTASPNQILKSGIYVGFENNITISQNSISNVSGSSGYAWGISLGLTATTTATTTGNEVTNATITRNLIGSVRASSTFGVAGIMIASAATGTNLIANNMIADANTNGTTNDIGAGIYIGGGAGTTQIYFNSVQMAGTLTGGAFGSFAVAINGSNPIVDMRDNILTSTGSTGANQNRAIGLAYSTFTNLTSNYNDLFVSGTGAAIGQTGTLSNTGGTISTTLANWQTNTGKDVNSISQNPLFLSATDLHISPTSPAVDAGVAAGSITIDIDGQTRPANAGYDIGADEVVPSPGTLQFSSTTYSATEVSTTATITVTRTGGSQGAASVNYATSDGTATGSTSCGGSVDYISTSGTLNWTAGDVAPKTFTVTICNDGVSELNETVNLTLSGATGATLGTPSTAVLTIINSETFNGAAVSVGTGQTYTSLTNPGGIFEAVNNGTIAANTIINITSNLTGETGAVALNQFVAGFTLTIKPSGGVRTITGTSSGGLIILNGADNVTIDGSLSGGTDRSLTVTNTGTGGVIQIASGTGGANNNAVRSVNVNGNAAATLTTLAGISIGGATVGSTATTLSSNNIVENNNIQSATFGIISLGVDNANKNTGTIIRNNSLIGTGNNRVGRVGIYVALEDGIQVIGNTVSGLSNSLTAAVIGIGVGAIDFNSTGIAGGEVSNAVVDRNYVGVVSSLNTYSAGGIVVAGSTTGTNRISNNMVTGVVSNGTAGDIGAGIFVGTAAGGTQNVYYNSVSMTGARGATTGQYGSFAIGITGGDFPVNLQNNAFFNSQTQSGGSTTGNSYAIGIGYATFANLNSNYNDFFVSGAQGVFGLTGGLVNTSGTDRTTFTAFKTATSTDNNSLNVNPSFVSTTDLHLQAAPGGTPNTLLGAGISIGAITTDFDIIDPRPASNPDIGADEVVQSVGGAIASGTFYNVSSANGDIIGDVTVTNSLTVNGVSTTGTNNTVTVDCNATVSGAGDANYINGNVKKNFCAAGTFTYPIGENGYSPATVTADSATVFPAALTVDAVDGVLSGLITTTSVTRSWQLTEDGNLSATLAFTYRQEDVQGTPDETTFGLFRNPGTLTFIPSTTNATTNTTTSNTAQTEFSPWGIGFAPTAASVDVGGRVREANGRGISRARVAMTDLDGNVRMAYTNQFGYFRFSQVAAGSTYIFTATHRRYQFNQGPQVRTINAATDNINFTSSGVSDNFRPEATFYERAPFDFDGDGVTDTAVFRGSENVWYIKRSASNTLFAQAFGAAGDRLAPADFDGDGKTDLAVFRSSEASWYIWQSASNSMRVEQFGADGDRLVPADFDGDGKADLSVWNDMSGVWRVKLSTDGSIVSQKFSSKRGVVNPIAADRNGDGKADFVLFDTLSGTWTTRTANGETVKEQFGQANDRAAVGDFDGDGLGDLAVYNTGENTWRIRFADGKELNDIRMADGAKVPVLGDFDGDGKYDVANFGNGVWSIRQSVSETIRQHQFGLESDTVIPAVNQ